MLHELRRLKRRIKKKFFKPEFEKCPNMPYPTVDLFYWRPQNTTNFGDEFGRTIVELMLAEKGYTLFDEVRRKRKLLTVGSVLHYAEDDTIVWGAGRNGAHPDRAHFFERLDVRAVRGPRTQAFLKSKGINAPDIFGDPALLLPRLTKGRFNITGEEEVALAPNLNDYEEGIDFSTFNIPVISPYQSWNKAVSELLRYRFIIASSLHALIIADAFGIPARYVRLTQREGLFKYHDYYEGTGRVLSDIPGSVAEALELGGEAPPKFDAEKLMAAFPYDIWE